jgi:hypothetical protein
VEAKFETLTQKEYTVIFDSKLEWFLGMHFTWHQNTHSTHCYVDQEAFILDLVDQYKLTDCNKLSRATPFRRGFPVETIKGSKIG